MQAFLATCHFPKAIVFKSYGMDFSSCSLEAKYSNMGLFDWIGSIFWCIDVWGGSTGFFTQLSTSMGYQASRFGYNTMHILCRNNNLL